MSDKSKASYRVQPVQKKGQRWTIVDPTKVELFVRPPKNEKGVDNWYEYNQSWYTLVVVDEKGKEVPATSQTMTMTLEFISDSGVDAQGVSLTTKSSKGGVFWFQSVDPSLFGELSMTFSSKSLFRGHAVDPLEIKIAIVKDIYGKGFRDSETTTTTNNKRGVEEMMFDDGNSESRGSLLLPKFARNHVSECDVIFMMSSTHPFLSALDRTERFTKQPEYNGKAGGWALDGPVVKIVLSWTLVVALMDDKARIETFFSLRNLEYDMRPLDQSRSNAQRPTVNELFHKLQHKMSSTSDCSNIVQHLRNSFEFFFEKNVLYIEEREMYKTKIDSIRSAHCKYGDNFGPIYFLRFLVFFVTAADETSFDESAASSSALRRNTLSSRLGKTAFARLQEFVATAIKDLNDGSDYYFC